MLRFVSTTLLLVVLASAANAYPVNLGVRAGSSVPNLRDHQSNDLSSGWSSRVAPFFGLFSDMAFTPAWSVMAEVNYAGQGGQREGMQPVIADLSGLGIPSGTTVYANYKNVAKLNYLEVPVLARYHFGMERRFSIGFGPFIGFLLSATTESSGVSAIYADKGGTQQLAPAQDFTATTDNKSDLHTFNWGLQTGVGFQQPVGKGSFDLEVRGGLGLTNIQKDTAANGSNGTGNLVIALGYAMPFGR